MSEPTPHILQQSDLGQPGEIIDLGHISEAGLAWALKQINELAALRTENAELRDLAHEQDTVLREKAQECDALRAQVAEQQHRWERAIPLLRMLASGQTVWVGEDPPAHVVVARALLGAGGQ